MRLNLTLFFVVFWLLICVLYCILYGYNDMTIIIFIGSISFLLGSLPAYWIFSTLKKKIRLKEFTINFRTENILISIYSIVFSISVFLAYLSLSWYRQGYDWGQIRGIFLAAEGIPGPLKLILVGFVVPCVYITGIVFSIEFFFSKHNRKRNILLFLSASSVVLYGFASQGRFVFLYFLVCLYISYITFGKKFETSKKIKKFLISLVGVILLMTVYRGIENAGDSSLITASMSIVNYMVLPIDMMNYYIPEFDKEKFIGEGLVFLGGFIDLLENFFNMVGVKVFTSLEQLDSILSTINDEPIDIRGGKANAFVSCFSYFYLDGRLLGVIIESAIFGFLTGMLEIKKKQSLVFYTYYLFAWILIAMSPARWGFTQMNIAMCPIYLWLFYKKY